MRHDHFEAETNSITTFKAEDDGLEERLHGKKKMAGVKVLNYRDSRHKLCFPPTKLWDSPMFFQDDFKFPLDLAIF